MQDEYSRKKALRGKIPPMIGTVMGVLIIITLIIGGALLASRQWDPKWNPFRQKVIPENIN